jgi:hypothetical protein
MDVVLIENCDSQADEELRLILPLREQQCLQGDSIVLERLAGQQFMADHGCSDGLV